MSKVSTIHSTTDKTEILYKQDEYIEAESESSGDEPPIQEWSSLIVSNAYMIPENPKRALHEEGMYSPGSGEVCAKYITVSSSSVKRHPYYKYPAVRDPGIKDALFSPFPKRPDYTDDGIKLYIDQCEEHNVYQIKLFINNLMKPEINLSHYCPSSANVRCMAIALEKNTFVKRLNLTGNYLDIDACYHLGQMLKVNKGLEELNLEDCKIREEGLQQLLNDIKFNNRLVTLNLAKNDIRDTGGERFARIIEDGINFKKLNLSYNKLGMRTAQALGNALLLQNDFEYLDLSWNAFIHLRSTVKFLEILAQTSKNLVELNLSWMGLEKVPVAKAIAEITLIPTLQVLDISDNRFTDDCAQDLVSNLKESKLQKYDLSRNLFTPIGACNILIPLLRRVVKLQNLYLDNICVNRNFIAILRNVRKMKSRKNFVLTHDKVLHDWIAVGKDPRELILKRGEYMGRMRKKKSLHRDVPMFLFSLGHATDRLRAKEFIVMMKDKKIPVTDDWVQGLIESFPGACIEKKPTVSTELMLEFMKRLWPELKLPPDWVPPILIRVDVKRKKIIQKSKSRLAMPKKLKKKLVNIRK